MTGKLLISAPFLCDPSFRRSVVLIVDHTDNEGTVGYVLNNCTPFALNTRVAGLECVSQNLYLGGPVDDKSLHYLHTYPQVSQSVKICDGVYWGGNFDQICNGLKTGSILQQNIRFFMGYSGWIGGQLQSEIEQNDWLIGHFEAHYLFQGSIPDNELWRYVMKQQSGLTSLLANAPIDPTLN